MDRPNEIISLDGKWSFAYTKEAPGDLNGNVPAKEDYETSIPVPAYWDDCREYLKFTKFWSRGCTFNPVYRSIDEFPLGGAKPPDASLPYLLGTGWYKTEFTAGDDWNDRCAVLYIGGAMLDVMVWLNGECIGNKYSCGKPVELRLDGHIKKKNELVIAVSNTRKDRTGCSIRGFKGRSGGISRSIELRISGRAAIEDCYVRSDEELQKLIWDIGLRRKDSSGLKLRWSIWNRLKEIAGGTKEISSDKLIFETDTFGMKPWSDRDPKLYNIKLELLNGEYIEDTYAQSFGLRFLRREGTQILLNNKPVLLRGTTDHAYFAESCTVPNDISYYMRTIKALKDAGFNWMRFHTTIPPEECMEAADRLGMMIQAETQNGFEEQEFIDMLMLCRKHPSVILYCCGNEVPITEEFEKTLEKMSGHCHTLAPGCLYDPMEAMLRVECLLDETEDGYTEKPVPHNAPRLEKIKKYSDVLATAVWVFSYESLYPDIEKINERMSIYERPCLIHEAGIFDTYLNLDLEKRYEGTRIGTDLYSAARKYISEMGMLDMAPTYYRNSCRWMKQLMKFAFEKARRCSAIGGYDFLGAIDCHWHRTGYAVGVMNEFYELKEGFTFEDLRRFNGESIIVSDAGHDRSLFAGEEKTVRLFSSLYGGEDLESGTLTWMLIDDKNEVRKSKVIGVSGIKNGKLQELASARVELHNVQGTGEHIRLRAELTGGIYAIANEWDYWIFNKPEKETAKNYREVTSLTENDIEYMENGGRVLLLGADPFPSLPLTFQIASGGRTSGNCATVIHDHPLMRSYPHNGFCDWQFEPMLEGGEAVLFNDMDIDFKPIVEVVSVYKYIRKQAGVFELKVGKGGLLVCALNISSKAASAKALYARLKEYIVSEEFEPAVKTDRNKLLEMIKDRISAQVDFETDECYDAGGYAEV